MRLLFSVRTRLVKDLLLIKPKKAMDCNSSGVDTTLCPGSLGRSIIVACVVDGRTASLTLDDHTGGRSNRLVTSILPPQKCVPIVVGGRKRNEKEWLMTILRKLKMMSMTIILLHLGGERAYSDTHISTRVKKKDLLRAFVCVENLYSLARIVIFSGSSAISYGGIRNVDEFSFQSPAFYQRTNCGLNSHFLHYPVQLSSFGCSIYRKVSTKLA